MYVYVYLNLTDEWLCACSSAPLW